MSTCVNGCVMCVWAHAHLRILSLPLLNTPPPPASLHGAHLDPGLGELGPLRELLPRVHVGVLRPLEGALELLQLLGGEGGPGAALLPLDGDARLALRVAV